MNHKKPFKKIVQFLLMVSFAFLLMTPLIFGLLYEYEYESIVDNLEESGITVLSSEYQFGYFSSTAKTTFIVGDVPVDHFDSDLHDTITVETEITQGPFINVQGYKWGIAHSDSRILINDKALYLDSEDPVLTTYIGFDSNITVLLDAPAREIVFDHSNLFIDHYGLVALYTTSNNEGDEMLRYEVQGFTFRERDKDLIVNGLAGTFFPGKGSMIPVERTVATAADITFLDRILQKETSLIGISIVSESSSPRDVFEGSLTIEVGRISNGDMSYGPIEASLAIEGINQSPIEKLQNTMAHIEEKYSSKPQEYERRMNKAWKQLAPKIVLGSPAVRVGPIKVATADGEAVFKAGVKANQLEIHDFKSDMYQSKIDLNAEIIVGKEMMLAFLEQNLLPKIISIHRREGTYSSVKKQQYRKEARTAAMNVLDSYADTGLVVDDGERYISSLKIRETELSINDTPQQQMIEMFQPIIQQFIEPYADLFGITL